MKLNFGVFLIIPPLRHFRGKMECIGGRVAAVKTERGTPKKILNTFKIF